MENFWLSLFAFVATASFGIEVTKSPEIVKGLDGYCPVTIVEKVSFRPGKIGLAYDYDGQRYYFVNEAAKGRFIDNPPKYVPALGGDCIVCFELHRERTRGKFQFSSFVDGRVYLFPNQATLNRFNDNWKKYVNLDLAYGGWCPVAWKEGRKQVGRTDLTVIHHGIRYRFATAAGRAAFVKDPSTFALK